MTALAATTRLGAVRLVARDADALAAFYERALGLSRVASADGTIALGADGGRALVELVPAPGAAARPPRTSGLFHLALLVPDRRALARAIARVAGTGWRFQGASDHLVSEAMYLADPEGNGIEIYRDRPRDEWPHDAEGGLRMDTLPIDLDGVMAELDDEPPARVEEGATIGHVHLSVADIPAADRFWIGAVGFDPVVRTYPGALFVSAGGYHHHLGLNTWASRGVPAPPRGTQGLDRFEVVLPDADALASAAASLAAGGVEPVAEGDGLLVADPAGNRVLLRVG